MVHAELTLVDAQRQVILPFEQPSWSDETRQGIPHAAVRNGDMRKEYLVPVGVVLLTSELPDRVREAGTRDADSGGQSEENGRETHDEKIIRDRWVV